MVGTLVIGSSPVCGYQEDCLGVLTFLAPENVKMIVIGKSTQRVARTSLRMWEPLLSKTDILHLGSRYSVSERRWTQMLAGAEDGGPGPSPRSFHAAAYVPAGRGAMYLLGGLTAGGITRDFWVLNLTTLQWRQEKVSLCLHPSPVLTTGPTDGHGNSFEFITRGICPQGSYRSVGIGAWNVS